MIGPQRQPSSLAKIKAEHKHTLQDMTDEIWIERLAEIAGCDTRPAAIAVKLESIMRERDRMLQTIGKLRGSTTIDPTEEQIDSVCHHYADNFDILDRWEQENLRAQARDWFIAWKKAKP